MKSNYIYKVLFMSALAVVSLASCNDYLDKLPDDRAELNTIEKVKSLLVSAYPAGSTNLIMEVSSDNVTDNGYSYNTSVLMEQLYNFEDVKEEGTDSPQHIWNAFYSAIGVCNQALAALDQLGAGNTPERAEALMCRAYSMFTLANTFCMSWNPDMADKYLGLPYPTKPQTTIHENYVRGTLRQLYANIDKDIEAALPYISDNYVTPKYHFTRKAAYAIAARFNLFYMKYDKAIQYANEVLGSDPASVMRDYAPYMALGRVDIGNRWIQTSEAGNILLMTAYSVAGRNVSGGGSPRFHHNQIICAYETFWPRGPWGSGSSDNTLYYSHMVYGSTMAVAFPKMEDQFEYTDKASGIGYPHIVDVICTGDETVLTRAEAYALRNKAGDQDLCLADLQTWINNHCAEVYEHIDEKTGEKSYTNRPILTHDMNNNFWNGLEYAPAVLEGNRDRSIRKKFNPQGFTIEKVENGKTPDNKFEPSQQENLLQMVLHLRRMERLLQGDRFIYLKRYGIEFSHMLAGHDPLKFKAGDLRGAIQLPQDVIHAGFEANPRETSTK